MTFFTIACAFHGTDRLLERTLPLAIDSLTRPTRHDFEVLLVADRSSDETVARLHSKLDRLPVDELRFRRTSRHSYSGAPSNNFHGNHFNTTSPYLVTFTDDAFIWKTDRDFDVLDAVATIFERHPEVAVLSKVDDHDEWDRPLVDLAEAVEPGVRAVNRAVDQLIAYQTQRFAAVAQRFGAWQRDIFVSHEDFEYQWEDLVSHVGTTGGRKIAYPERWPLRVRHCDLRLDRASMHGTQDEDVKLKCFDSLLASEGTAKGDRTEHGR